MKRMTKVKIDELANLWIEMKAKQKEFKAAENAYKLALAPVVEYINDKVPAKDAAQLKGVAHTIAFGKRKERRHLVDAVTGLLALEKKEKGLGYANISIPLKVFDDYLTPVEREELFEVTLAERSVKVID